MSSIRKTRKVPLPILFLFASALFSPRPAPAQSQDLFGGNVIQFDDNGIWTWYSDERAVVDRPGGKLVIGCVENGAGIGGIPRDGNISVSIFDMQGLTG